MRVVEVRITFDHHSACLSVHKCEVMCGWWNGLLNRLCSVSSVVVLLVLVLFLR